MIEQLRGDVSHLDHFVVALKQALPQLSESQLYWRLHFCLGMVHNNRPAEFERLSRLSHGVTRDAEADTILDQMLAFASSGFGAG